jgi:LacI family transcriptional regulator
MRKSNASVTIIDVARFAGVSMKTVSRVINNEVSVSDATRERVASAVERLGYQRNVFARGLRANASLVLGLLYENPQGDYPADILYGALAESRRRGYHLVVEVLRGGDLEEQTQRFLSQTRLDGVLMTPPVCDDPKVMGLLRQYDTPYVRISPREPMPGEAYIAIDDKQAAHDAIAHLLGLGHRRIGFVKGLCDHAATRLRLQGYQDALAQAGLVLDNDLIVDGDFSFTAGQTAARRLLDLSPKVTAIFACNDEMAAGAISYAHDRGLSIPREVSVIGFDGGTVSRVVWPPLTTVYQPIQDLGAQAVALLTASEAERGTARGKPLIMPHALILRQSTGPCP